MEKEDSDSDGASSSDSSDEEYSGTSSSSSSSSPVKEKKDTAVSQEKNTTSAPVPAPKRLPKKPRQQQFSFDNRTKMVAVAKLKNGRSKSMDLYPFRGEKLDQVIKWVEEQKFLSDETKFKMLFDFVDGGFLGMLRGNKVLKRPSDSSYVPYGHYLEDSVWNKAQEAYDVSEKEKFRQDVKATFQNFTFLSGVRKNATFVYLMSLAVEEIYYKLTQEAFFFVEGGDASSSPFINMFREKGGRGGGGGGVKKKRNREEAEEEEEEEEGPPAKKTLLPPPPPTQRQIRDQKNTPHPDVSRLTGIIDVFQSSLPLSAAPSRVGTPETTTTTTLEVLSPFPTLASPPRPQRHPISRYPVKVGIPIGVTEPPTGPPTEEDDDEEEEENDDDDNDYPPGEEDDGEYVSEEETTMEVVKDDFKKFADKVADSIPSHTPTPTSFNGSSPALKSMTVQVPLVQVPLVQVVRKKIVVQEEEDDDDDEELVPIPLSPPPPPLSSSSSSSSSPSSLLVFIKGGETKPPPPSLFPRDDWIKLMLAKKPEGMTLKHCSSFDEFFMSMPALRTVNVFKIVILTTKQHIDPELQDQASCIASMARIFLFKHHQVTLLHVEQEEAEPKPCTSKNISPDVDMVSVCLGNLREGLILTADLVDKFIRIRDGNNGLAGKVFSTICPSP